MQEDSLEFCGLQGTGYEKGSLIDQDYLLNMQFFVAVAHAKSFTRAAAAVQVAPSTLSRRITQFERSIGLRLLNRTTRFVEVTAEGAEYLRRAERILEEIRSAHEDLKAHRGAPTGLLRISIPSSLALPAAMPWMAEFSRLNPAIKVEIDTRPTTAGPIADGFDISIMDSSLNDSRLTSRRLATFRMTLFASPSYLRDHGVPQDPADLANHDCIISAPGLNSVWKLRHEDTGEIVPVETQGRFRISDLILGPMLAVDQGGIARGVKNDWQDLLQSRALERVLPGWEAEPHVITAVMATSMLPAKARVFLEFIAQKLKIVERALG